MTGTGTKEQGPPPLLLTLTVVTGVVDAVSILQLGRVFVAKMTGERGVRVRLRVAQRVCASRRGRKR
jgi:Protein of unknown function (DUF1275)